MRNITAKTLHGYMPKYIGLAGGQLVAHPILGFGISLLIPCAPPSSAGWLGDVGEDCLST